MHALLPARLFELLSGSRLSEPPVSYIAAAMTILLAAFAGRRLLRKKPKSPPRRLRATSIGSTRFMVSGTVDTPQFDTLINICCTMDPVPDLNRLKADFSAEVLPHQRMHSVPFQRKPLDQVVWIAQRVDLEHHFVVHDVPTTAAARTLIDHLASMLLRDKSRPWWEIHLIRPADSKAGFMIIRVHHAIGDGVSLMEAFAPLLRDQFGGKLDLSSQFNPRHQTAKSKRSFNPFRAVAYWATFVQEVLRVVGFAALPGDKDNRFVHDRWPYTGRRITVYMPSHKLSVIKAIKDKAGAGVTVNDVEFALFAGTLRRFLEKHDPKVDLNKATMRAMTPLALLERVDPGTQYSTVLRNLFTFVVNELPTKKGTPLERLRASHASWNRLKTCAAVPAAFFIHNVSSRLPLAMQRQTLRDLFCRMSCVFSNVPGPQGRCFVAGSEVTAVHMIYPNIIPQVGILSLNGQVHMCLSVVADDQGVDLRKELPRCFQEELAALAAEVGVALE
jgi:hypothetical protein